MANCQEPMNAKLNIEEQNIRLVQEPGWFLNKLSKILRILQFL